MSCYDNFLFDFLGSIFGYVLNFFYELFKNYGAAVVLFTIFTRIISFPLSIKQQKQMIAQQRIQPKLAELKERCGNNTELYNTEMQKLYQKEGVKMSMGCGSMGLQLILFTGMYMAVRKPLTNVLRLSEDTINKLLGLFGINAGDNKNYYAEVTVFSKIRDFMENGGSMVVSSGDAVVSASNAAVSASDALVSASDLIVSGSDTIASASDALATIDMATLTSILGDKTDEVVNMSQRFNFLGFDLLQIASFKPFNSALILAIIVFILQILSMEISNKINKTTSSGMAGCSPRMMSIGMGAFSFWISLTIPAAFPLYWATSSILAPVQTWVTKKYFGALPMNAKAEAQRSAMLKEDEQKIIDGIVARKGERKFAPCEPEKFVPAQNQSKPQNGKKKGKK